MAARLRNLGKMVAVSRTDEDRLSQAQQALRNEDVYHGAEACPACQAARQRGPDDTALCDEHLRRAMGL